MTSVAAIPAPRVTRLDYDLLKRGMAIFAVLNWCFAPFAPDPAAYAVGATTPWVLLAIVGRPTMPMAVAYLFLWQWGQVFARALQAVFDGESMAAGLYGPDVLRAYWYMLAGLVTMALAFRLVLGNLRGPTTEEYYGHERWRVNDLAMLYGVSVLAATVLSIGGRMVSSLDQPLEAASRVKIVCLFLLCTYVFTTGKGRYWLLGAVVFEILVGFTGFLSDFRGVFVFVAIAALASRIKWSGSATALSILWIAVLIFLALFWTSVKGDYRNYVTGYDENTQAISVPLEERMGYLGDKFLSVGDTKWGDTAYLLLIRFAYVDIFGQVIGVAESSPEQIPMRQWQDALSHVFQPRFLFPDKGVLSDTEVYMRLARADPFEQIRLGTSISVGYMAENFVDLGFPGMLAGLFVIGAVLALIIRYFMTRPLPWMIREGIVMGFAFSMARDGMEVSLPKVFGAMLMYFIVWALIVKFALPIAIRWLDQRSAAERRVGRVR